MTDVVIGVKELKNKLKAIDKATQPQLIERSARSALVPMRRAAIQGAPKGRREHRTYKGRLVAPGFLKRNIGIRKLKFQDKNHVGYSLKARKEGFYGSIVETGFIHKGGFGKNKTGKRTRVPGQPWLGPAFLQEKANVDTLFRREILKRINKAIKK